MSVGSIPVSTSVDSLAQGSPVVTTPNAGWHKGDSPKGAPDSGSGAPLARAGNFFLANARDSQSGGERPFSAEASSGAKSFTLTGLPTGASRMPALNIDQGESSISPIAQIAQIAQISQIAQEALRFVKEVQAENAELRSRLDQQDALIKSLIKKFQESQS